MAQGTYQAGSSADFDRLYRDTYARVLQTVMAIVREPAAAEDCVQEAFERAYAAWPRFRPDAPAPVWIHRIAINVALTYRRRHTLRQVGETIRRLGRPELVADATVTTDQMDLVSALHELPARQAAALVLRHLHGYTNREIASAIGVPERTVASRLAAAKRKLAEKLGEPGNHTPWSDSGSESHRSPTPTHARVQQQGTSNA
ncbi:MAG: RNA polymerase sigma factor [Candidatus Dormibacteria bacterium]